MDELQKALTSMGIEWVDVWRLSLDRQSEQVVVVARDGRKFTGLLAAPVALEAPPRRVKAIKRAAMSARLGRR
jgi:hypothetical protein